MGENRRIVRCFREKIVKSLLDVLILKSIKDGCGVTGYYMMREIGDKHGVLLSSGTVYSMLYSLERKGLIQSGLKGRSRVYSLTDKGESFIEAIMGDQQTLQFMVLLEKPLSNARSEKAGS
jgi:DNA-binding PadR family transcriptional regulator